MLRRKKSKSKMVLEQMEKAKANLISTPGAGLGELTDEQWSEIAECVRKGRKVQDALVMKLILRAVSTGAAAFASPRCFCTVVATAIRAAYHDGDCFVTQVYRTCPYDCI